MKKLNELGADYSWAARVEVTTIFTISRTFARFS
jgi:hypothetical protein